MRYAEYLAARAARDLGGCGGGFFSTFLGRVVGEDFGGFGGDLGGENGADLGADLGGAGADSRDLNSNLDEIFRDVARCEMCELFKICKSKLALADCVAADGSAFHQASCGQRLGFLAALARECGELGGGGENLGGSGGDLSAGFGGDVGGGGELYAALQRAKSATICVTFLPLINAANSNLGAGGAGFVNNYGSAGANGAGANANLSAGGAGFANYKNGGNFGGDFAQNVGVNRAAATNFAPNSAMSNHAPNPAQRPAQNRAQTPATASLLGLYQTALIKCAASSHARVGARSLGLCGGFFAAEVRALRPRVVVSFGERAFGALTGFRGAFGCAVGGVFRVGRMLVLAAGEPFLYLRDSRRAAALLARILRLQGLK